MREPPSENGCAALGHRSQIEDDSSAAVFAFASHQLAQKIRVSQDFGYDCGCASAPSPPLATCPKPSVELLDFS